MPSLSDALSVNTSANYEAVPSGSGPQVATSLPNSQPGFTGMTTSPLPILSNSSPDNLRTFYQGTSIPQTRILNPPPVSTTVQKITNVTNVTNKVPTGLSVTIVTAALTTGGTQGSMTFTNGLLTKQTPAT
jgi:hypothetical protein